MKMHSQTSSNAIPYGNESMWDLIWKSDVPPKIKVFTWKLAVNSFFVV
jgi:hypothetical protein